MKITSILTYPVYSILSLCMIFIFHGCEKQEPVKPEPPKVTITTPVPQNIRPYYDCTGNTEAYQTADIRARVEGFLEKIHFEDGIKVKEGDLLFSIEKELFLANLEQAKATLESKTAELKRAQSDFDRVAMALKSNAVSEQEMDLKEAQRDIAQAAVSQAKAMLMQAQLQLDYTDVKSPIAGKISRRFVDVGNLVGSGEKTLLARVVRMDPLYVNFDLSETMLIEYLKRISQADQAETRSSVTFYLSISDDDYSHEGVIDYLDNQLDPKTGTIQIRGIVANPQNLLYPGMFVKIRIPSPQETPALLVYEKAIGTDLGGKYLFVVGQDNLVERRYVTLGQRYNDMRVIEKGIGEKEKYIVKGIQRARPGMPVTPSEQDSDSGN